MFYVGAILVIESAYFLDFHINQNTMISFGRFHFTKLKNLEAFSVYCESEHMLYDNDDMQM